MAVSENFLRPARVLSEDDDTMLVEVRKSVDARPDVDRGDRWVSVVFIRDGGDHTPEPWLPWRDAVN